LLQSINKTLQRLAILLQVFWVFFPGILFLSVAYFFFIDTLQGKDIIITGLYSKQTGFLFVIGLLFWTLITWYTSRLIAYNNDRLFHIAKDELYQMPRLLGYLCFTIIIIAFAKIKYDIQNNAVVIILILTSIGLFFSSHYLFEKIKDNLHRNELKSLR
jgi:hypothetical protein